MKLLFLLSIFLLNFSNVVFSIKNKELHTISFDFKSNGICTTQDNLIAFNKNSVFSFNKKTMSFQLHKKLPFLIEFAIPYHNDYYILSKNDLIIPIKNPNYQNIKTPNYTNVKLFNNKLFFISNENCLIDIYNIETQNFTKIDLSRKPIDIYFDEKTNLLFVLANESAEKQSYLIKLFGEDFKNHTELFLSNTISDEIDENHLCFHQQKLYALLEKQIKIIDIEKFNVTEQINCANDQSFLVHNIYIDNGLLYCSYISNPIYMNDTFTDDDNEEYSDVESAYSTNEDEELSNNIQFSEIEAETEVEIQGNIQLTENTSLYLPLINDEKGNQTILDIIDLKKNKHLHRFTLENSIHSFLIFNENIFFEMHNTIEFISKCITPDALTKDKKIYTLNSNALKHITLCKKTNIYSIEQKLFHELNNYEDQFIITSMYENLLKRESSHHTPKVFKDSARTMDLYERSILLSKLANNLNWRIFEKASDYMNFLMKRGNTSDCFALQLVYCSNTNLKDYFKLLALSEGSILENTRIEKRILFLRKFSKKIKQNKDNLSRFINNLKKSIFTTLKLDKENFELFIAELTKCYELLTTDYEKNIFKQSFVEPFLENIH